MKRGAMTLLLAVLAGLGAACAAGGGGSAFSGYTVTAANLEGSPYRSAFDVLDRHNYVVFRGGDMYIYGRGEQTLQVSTQALLVIDGSQMGGSAAPVLQGISSETIDRIDILRPVEATQRFGRNGQGGAVLIRLKSG